MPNFIDNFGKEKKSERISKEAHIKRIERDMAGNPLLKDKKKFNLPPPDALNRENQKYQDYLGNPLPGYKWKGNKIIEDKKYKKEREEHEKYLADELNKRTVNMYPLTKLNFIINGKL